MQNFGAICILTSLPSVFPFSPSASCCFHMPKHCPALPSHFPCCLDPFSSCCEQEDPTYFAIWGDNKAFNEVIISPAMLHEHLPYVVMEGLNKVRQGIAIPKNTSTGRPCPGMLLVKYTRPFILEKRRKGDAPAQSWHGMLEWGMVRSGNGIPKIPEAPVSKFNVRTTRGWVVTVHSRSCR